MNGIKLTLLALFLSACCTSDKCIAITASNLMYDGGIAAAETLKLACTDQYAQAESTERVASLDKECLPAAEGYATLRTSHSALVLLLSAVLAGGDADGLSAALARAREAASHLGLLIGGLSK